MPPPLSTLGVFHTFATVLAIYLAIDALIAEGRINLKSRNGKAYFVLTAFGCVSTLWLVARTGHYGPGHALGLIVMILLLLALGLEGRARYRLPQAIIMTTTLLFSLIPSIMETLTRLPVQAPLATGPEDNLVKASLTLAFLGYLATIFWQIKKLKPKG
jgi:hypothetical protein